MAKKDNEIKPRSTVILASFPGPAQLSVAISTVIHTASDEKLGGAWVRGYHHSTLQIKRLSIFEPKVAKRYFVWLFFRRNVSSWPLWGF